MLTEVELALCEELGDWFNAFVRLPREHPSDTAEAVFHIHALQTIVMARGARRNHPDVFTNISGHFHNPGRLRPCGRPIVMNGTFVTSDEYAVRVNRYDGRVL